MPSPVVEDAAESEESGSGDFVPTMPSGIVADSGILFVYGVRSNIAVTTPTGYVATGDIEDDSSNRLWVFHRQATGDSNDDITVAVGGFLRKTGIVHRISGHEDFATQAPELSTGDVGESSDAPDPPDFTPTGGPKDFLAIAIGQIRETGGTQALTNDPSGYTPIHDIMSSGTTTGVITATARLALTAQSSENPGAWLFDTSSRFIGLWVAVHPVAVAAGVFPPFKRKVNTLVRI